jgi:5'-3' exonuclease
MLQLADWLKEWAAGKVTSDVRFKHVTFIISDAFEPGEGEHKVRLNSMFRMFERKTRSCDA